MGFEEFEEAYKECFDLYVEDKEKIYLSRRFFFPIAILTPRHGYTNSNAYYDFIIKLQRELRGRVYTRQLYMSEKEYKYYTGLACIQYIIQNLEQELDSPVKGEDIARYQNSCLKLSEYQHMLLRSMKWFIKELQVKSEDAEALITEYAYYCDLTYNVVLLFCKYSIKPDNNTIKRIISNLNLIYTKEGEILEKVIPIFIDEYTTHLNSK